MYNIRINISEQHTVFLFDLHQSVANDNILILLSKTKLACACIALLVKACLNKLITLTQMKLANILLLINCFSFNFYLCLFQIKVVLFVLVIFISQFLRKLSL